MAYTKFNSDRKLNSCYETSVDPTLAALLGAGIGAVAGLAGAVLTYALQARLERDKWLRDRRVEAYTSAIRYLIRVSNKRSSLTADGGTVLAQDAMQEWFDEISEARSWLTSLLIYCSDGERNRLDAAIHDLNAAAAAFLTSGASLKSLLERAQLTCVQVVASARNDIRANIASPNPAIQGTRYTS